MNELAENQTYVYCYYPNNRFAYMRNEWIEAEPEIHSISRHIVNVDDIPEDPAKYTFDGTTWVVIADIDNERNMYSLRSERNRRLAETDWWAVADRTMTAEQTQYRQMLRDITNSYTSLDDVVWPIKP